MFFRPRLHAVSWCVTYFVPFAVSGLPPVTVLVSSTWNRWPVDTQHLPPLLFSYFLASPTPPHPIAITISGPAISRRSRSQTKMIRMRLTLRLRTGRGRSRRTTIWRYCNRTTMWWRTMRIRKVPRIQRRLWPTPGRRPTLIRPYGPGSRMT